MTIKSNSKQFCVIIWSVCWTKGAYSFTFVCCVFVTVLCTGPTMQNTYTTACSIDDKLWS